MHPRGAAIRRLRYMSADRRRWLRRGARRNAVTGLLFARVSAPSPREGLLRCPMEPPSLFAGSPLARDRRGLINGTIWPQDGWRIDRLGAMAAARLSSPGLAPRARKSARGTSARPFLARQVSRSVAILRCSPALTGASSIACGLLIAIETAMVASSDSQGETTWPVSTKSSSSATWRRSRNTPHPGWPAHRQSAAGHIRDMARQEYRRAPPAN
jgi:hypothetical protein